MNMNTIGKTLVILNFVFAVIVGGLLVFDVALRNQWKERYEALQREALVLKSAREQDQRAMQNLTADLRSARLENEGIKQAMKDRDVIYGTNEDTVREEKRELEAKLKNIDITLQETQKAKLRLTQEIALLTKTVKDREGLIVALELDVKKYRIEAQNFENTARARQSQNENLLQQVRDLTYRITSMETGLAPGAVVIDPSRPNPPPVTINGIVEFVDGDLVQVSLGTDHGLDKHNTLDIYRLKPEPKYLGMVRITDAKHKSSVGRLIQTGNVSFRPVLQQGDLVTSKLSR
jgi:hypothetical protein